MATRGGIGFVLAMGLVLGSMASGSHSEAADLVKLEGWANQGILIRGEGMSPDLILLVAEAEWDKSASRDPAKYAVRVSLPDGSTQTRAFPVENPPWNRRFVVYVPATPLRGLRPSAAVARVTVVDATTGAALSNPLSVGIENLPRLKGDASAVDPGPFGWGKPLGEESRTLAASGPVGFVFARVFSTSLTPGFFVSTTEATVKQVLDRLPGYDPKAGRSDEFVLEDPLQPAIGLTPAKALEFLKALSSTDPSGIEYRLPTIQEWNIAAKGGNPTAFWWGDDAKYPAGANLIGPEPALGLDTTSPSQPLSGDLRFAANPFGLFHTYGNVAEWATAPNAGYARMGGHFRTEAESPLPEVLVAKDDEVGPDPFVGIRPVFSLTSDRGASLALKRLIGDPLLARVNVAYNPDTATITLTGPVPDSSSRRSADSLLEGIGFVSCVVNQLETPRLLPGQLATLGSPLGAIRIKASLDRTMLEVPLAVRWYDPLPMVGSEWWVNVYLPGGGHLAHRLAEGEGGRSPKVLVAIDRSKLVALGLTDTTPFTVALSLGAPAPTLADPRISTNSVEVRPTTSTKSPK